MKENIAEELNLRSLPDFIRSNFPDYQGKDCKSFPSREKLHNRLSSLLGKYFSEYSLEIEDSDVSGAFDSLPAWRIDTVLAKLRAVMESKAKKQIREFCSKLSYPEKQSTQALLNNAGKHSFRQSIELDLYVGVHTAISAYFKMAGLALLRQREQGTNIPVKTLCEPLFKTLRFVASLSLRHLLALDGPFWDSKQYSIPAEIKARLTEDGRPEYFTDREVLISRLGSIRPDEQVLGCPALSARTNLNQRVITVVEDCCLKAVQEYFVGRQSGVEK